LGGIVKVPDITFEHVTLVYRSQEALGDISFTIRENTICGLLGRNGAGKTSLMSLIASYRRPTKGSVRIGGEPVFNNPRVMPQVAFVHSRNEDGADDRVTERLSMASQFRPNWDADYALRLLEIFEIQPNKRIHALSLGMKASVNAIIGLAGRTPVTMYDEVYLGMDAAIRRSFIREILEDYMRFPRTVLFSTHFIGEVENLLEEVLVLSEGKVFLQDDMDNIRSKGLVISGDSAAVEEFIAALGLKPLDVRTLGTQKELIFFGGITQENRQQGERMGLSFSRPPLQELFIHMTEKQADIQKQQD
jgi:ABC-2 type transport system ATP-binding protein